jgi:hypothetical protein
LDLCVATKAWSIVKEQQFAGHGIPLELMVMNKAVFVMEEREP